MSLAIIAALDDEIRPLLNEINIDITIQQNSFCIRKGMIKGHLVFLGRSGIGAKAMQSLCDYMCTHESITYMLHIGYCGASDPRLETGDLVVANQLICTSTQKSYAPLQSNVGQVQQILQENKLRYKVGGIATVDAAISSPHEKAYIASSYDAIAIDMESAMLAMHMQSANIEYTVVRAVFDTLDMQLPDFESALDNTGKIKPFYMAGHLIKTPKDLLKIPKLATAANQAKQSLYQFVHAYLNQWGG